MRSLVIAALAAGAALATGCTAARGVGAPAPLAAGRAEYMPGLGEGYWIWQDSDGWHLRTTSTLPRRFHGAVEAVGRADLDRVRPVGGASAEVAGGGRTILFSWGSAGGSERGFDWTNPSGCNRFALYVDGDPNPLAVFLGGTGENPSRIPFALCRG